MPTLYVTIGAPGAGKSTWAKEILDGVWVSRDEIRNEIVGLDRAEQEGRKVNYFSKEDTVYSVFILAIQKNLSEGKDVIADATHIDKKARDKLFRMLNAKGKLYDEAIAVVFDVTPQTCIARNRLRKGWRRVPDHVINEMYSKFYRDFYTLDQHFDKVIIVNEKGEYKYAK